MLLVALAAGRAAADPVRLGIDAGAGTTYDSNLFRLSPLEKRISRFQSVDDVTVLPHVAGQLVVPLGLQELSLAGRVSRQFHAYNTDLDTTETGLAARLRYALPFDCSGTLGAHQFRRLTAYDDILGNPRRITVRDRLAEGSALCSITPSLAARADASLGDRANRDPLLSAFDLRELSARGEIAYGLVDTLQPFVAARYRHREQPKFASALTPDGTRASIVDAGGGLRWSPTQYLMLSGAASWTRLRENSHRRDGDLATGEIVVDWDATGKTRLHLEAVRSLDVSPNVGAIAYPATTLLARASWDATPLLTASLETRYRHRALLRDLSLAALPLTRRERDNTVGIDARVEYKITDKFVARAAAGYRDRSANFADLEYRAAIVTVGLSYRFAGPPLDVGLE